MFGVKDTSGMYVVLARIGDVIDARFVLLCRYSRRWLSPQGDGNADTRAFLSRAFKVVVYHGWELDNVAFNDYQTL